MAGAAPKRGGWSDQRFYKENISLFQDHIDLCTNTLSPAPPELPSLREKLMRCLETNSMENRAIALSLLLVKTYSIKEDRSLLQKLVTMAKESELTRCLNPIMFWMLHLLGTINYYDYVALVDFASFSSYIYNIISGTDTTDIDTINMRKYNKKHSITSEILLYLLDSRQFDILYSIIYLDHLGSHEPSQSDVFTSTIHPKPYIVSTIKLTALLDIANVLQKHDSCGLIEEWKRENAKRLLSCIITSSGSSSCKDVVTKVIDMLTPAVLLKEIEKEMRSSTDSIFDFAFMIWLKKQIDLTRESFLFLFFDLSNSMSKIGKLVNNIAFDGVSEENVALWLRSIFLVEQMSLFSEFLILARTGGNIPCSIRFNDWMDVILGPKLVFLNPTSGVDSDKSLDNDQLHSVIYNQRNIAFVCCASLEVIDKLSETNLKVLCNQLRARYQLNKESIDVFINTSRSRIQQIDRARASLSDDMDGGEIRTLPEIDAQRVKMWWETLQRTKLLPASISQTIKMNGAKGVRAMLCTFKLLALRDPSIKRMLGELVSAMASSSLCTYHEAETFRNCEKDVEFMLESLSLPPLVLKHVAATIKYIQQMQTLMSKYCLNSTIVDSKEFTDTSAAQLMHQQRIECFDQWKQSVKLALACDDIKVNIKIATVITTSIMQSLTLLSKLIHECGSSIIIKPPHFSMYVFVNNWSDWFKCVFDVIGEHDLIVTSVVGIILSKEGVHGDHSAAMDGTIANSSSLGLAFSLFTAPVQLTLLNNLFLRYNPSNQGIMNTNILLLNVLGYMYYSLTWSMCFICCHGESCLSIQPDKVLKIIQGLAKPSEFSLQYDTYLKLAHAKNAVVSCVFMWLYNYLQETSTKSSVTPQISYMYQNCSEQSDCHHVNINVAKVFNDPVFRMILEWEMTCQCDLFSTMSMSQRTASYYKLYGMLCLGDTYDRSDTNISSEGAHQLWDAVTNLLCGVVEKTNAYRPGEYNAYISGSSKNLVASVINSFVCHVKTTFISQLDDVNSTSLIAKQKSAMQIILRSWMRLCKHAIAFEFSLATISATMLLVAKELLALCAGDNVTPDCAKWFLWLVHGNHTILHNLSLDFNHVTEILGHNSYAAAPFPLHHVCDALKFINTPNGMFMQDVAAISMQDMPILAINKWSSYGAQVILNDCIGIIHMLRVGDATNCLSPDYLTSLKNNFVETVVNGMLPSHQIQRYVRTVGWVLVPIILYYVRDVVEIKSKLPILLQYFDRTLTEKVHVDFTIYMASSCMLIESTESLLASSIPVVKSNSIILLRLLITHVMVQDENSLVTALRQELESQLPVDIVDEMIARHQDSLINEAGLNDVFL